MRVFDIIEPGLAMERLFNAMEIAGSGTDIEIIDSLTARGRVIAEDVVSGVPMPQFRRSTVDGYAIRAQDIGHEFRMIGESSMGQLFNKRIGQDEAVRVHTGGNVPDGADAVLMLEDSLVEHGTTALRSSIQTLNIGSNIIEVGEDVQPGERVIDAGTRLREQEIGGLAALGRIQVHAYARPRVAIIASGDEVVAPNESPRPGQVRDVNTYTVSNLIRANGGLPIHYQILHDESIDFEQTARQAFAECDMVIFMAGSSVSERDLTPDVVATLGAPGILAHGIAFRPGKPTLFALCDGKPVLGLPGNPISALVTAILFAVPVVWRMQHAVNGPPVAAMDAILAAPVNSPKTLEHWFAVRLEGNKAIPVLSKSNLIFGLTRAHGMACVPIGTELLEEGSTVQVRLF